MPLVEPNEVCTEVQNSLADLKAHNIVVLDVVDKADFTDYMVVATGTSNRHVAALVDAVVHHVKSMDYHIIGVEGRDFCEWVLVDLGDVVVHVMQSDARGFYGLERLWGEFESASLTA